MPSDKGKASREVVTGLIRDMRRFNEVVDEQLKAMENESKTLGESWRDPQYLQFNAFINELSVSLKKDLDVFAEATDALQRKLDLYQ